MKKALFASVALVALAGCTHGGLRGAPHVLRIALAADPASLVPMLAIDQEVIGVDGFFCQTLVGLSSENRPVPLLVTRIPSRSNGDVSPDGTRIVYHLRRGVRFADGAPFTSADVAFTYRALFDPRNRSVSLEPYRRILSLQTPDAYTVVVRLRGPWNAAVSVLFAQADYVYGILPKHAFADTQVVGTRWEDAPFCTGPFRVKSWQRGDRIVLEPNPYYSPRPKLSRIDLQIVPSLNSNFIALRSGAVDVGTLTPENVAQAAQIAALRVLRVPENGTGLLYLNTQAFPTRDVRVRRAIAAALNYDALAGAWRREYPPATSFLPPPIVRWKSVAIPTYAYDPAAAAREFDAAGWHLRGGVRWKGAAPLSGLIGMDSENPIQVRIATLLQSQLSAAGMQLSIKSNPTRIWFSPEGLLRNGKATFAVETWVGGGDPEQSLNLRCVQAVKGDSNHSFYCSKAFEALYDDQTRTPIPAQRDRDFNAIEQLIHADVPVIPLYYEQRLLGLNRRVSGYAINMLWIPTQPERWDAQP